MESIRPVLADECKLCREISETHASTNTADVADDAAKHRSHRDEHLAVGLKEVLGHVISLVWPAIVTRETPSSTAKDLSESDRRQVHISLLYAMIMSELEGTVWYRSNLVKTSLTKKQLRTHADGVESIEQNLRGWIMNSAKESRWTW